MGIVVVGSRSSKEPVDHLADEPERGYKYVLLLSNDVGEA